LPKTNRKHGLHLITSSAGIPSLLPIIRESDLSSFLCSIAISRKVLKAIWA